MRQQLEKKQADLLGSYLKRLCRINLVGTLLRIVVSEGNLEWATIKKVIDLRQFSSNGVLDK